ncbi:MAG: DUF1232 domain-containing protein [Chloroflexi bacterium]|nr:DUF1232 domain-containing protein [Chloroflexota bacterium]
MRAPRAAWRERVRALQRETYTLALAARHPRTPWYARLWVALVVGYALCPLDLVPDFVPVLGQLDDLLLVPLGILVAIRLIPPPVLAECRQQARQTMDAGSTSAVRVATLAVAAIWFAVLVLVAWLLGRHLRG